MEYWCVKLQPLSCALSGFLREVNAKSPMLKFMSLLRPNWMETFSRRPTYEYTAQSLRAARRLPRKQLGMHNGCFRGFAKAFLSRKRSFTLKKRKPEAKIFRESRVQEDLSFYPLHFQFHPKEQLSTSFRSFYRKRCLWRVTGALVLASKKKKRSKYKIEKKETKKNRFGFKGQGTYCHRCALLRGEVKRWR